jgi:DegV family protein with EDD domain
MSFIGLVSDSTPGLSDDYVAQHENLRVVPLYLQMGDKTLRDGVDIKGDEFYQRLPQMSTLPTTSQPSVGDFQACYQELVAAGASGIVSIHLSSGISGTINSATLARQEIDVPVEIVDTQSAAASHLLTVETAQRAIARGASLEEVAEAARKVAEQQRTVFAVETLEYLYKGGRIGGAAALVGSLLQMKPLLYFKDGRIDALEKVRTSKRAMGRMVDLMGEWLDGQGPLEVMVMHAAAPDRVEELAAAVQKNLPVASMHTVLVPPVLGAHCGPGALGLCCCPASALGKNGS